MENTEEIINELFTLRDMIRFGITNFNKSGIYFGHGTDNALDEATSLCLFALKLPHDLPGHFMDAALTEEEKLDILDLYDQRTNQRIPVPYLTHEAWFANHKFYVDERVLVPRSPLAELITNHFEPWLNPNNIFDVLDMCTGSACIAIATAYALPDAEVHAVDISKDALAVAEINVQQHHMQDQVKLFQSDLFESLADYSYDLILSNPPYVDEDEMAALPTEYRHEPELGLASGPEGLDHINRILRTAAAFLNDEGILIAEVGASEEALADAYPHVPFYWFEFENGGSGVFMLTKQQLIEYFGDEAE
ncbi:MAG: 50S ribosomal protein L3 N(5)-glutamine methyltransferase [Gammaproteobacteria bacterium]|nr:50S ribosomal protein L3 N(5)-glutamine methyltransferase [Gammaproteobacteria bacterium]